MHVYLPPPATCANIVTDAIPLQILYEDDALVVLNKQAGLTVHPCPGVPRGTMVNALAHHFTTPNFNPPPISAGVAGEGSAAATGGLSSVGALGARPGIVHRLDRYLLPPAPHARALDSPAHWRGMAALSSCWCLVLLVPVFVALVLPCLSLLLLLPPTSLLLLHLSRAARRQAGRRQ
jgi:hypothetical protein